MYKCIVNVVVALYLSLSNSIAAFNILTIIKNWSWQGSADFPMPKELLLTDQLIREEGFGAEQHDVITNDGHILPLTRIIMPNKTQIGDMRLPILVIHGLWACSDTWLLRGQHIDLPYILTKLGYDVWLGDTRGNFYGKRHKTLSTDDPRFWNYSFHEHGLYDLPAMVDHILNQTNAPQIGYIGHSMGTTNFLVFASSRPEYNQKIYGAILLAPVAAQYPMDEVASPLLRVALSQINKIYNFAIEGGLYEILPRTPKLVYNMLKLCSKIPGLYYCLDILGTAMGEHRQNLDTTNCAVQLAHFPAGSSLKTFHHLGQIFNNGFRQYDYGQKLNKLKYNTTLPPYYPIHQITAPVLLIYGENDPWTSDSGVKYLASRIPNSETVLVQDNRFTHGDFLIGQNTNETLLEHILTFFSKKRTDLVFNN